MQSYRRVAWVVALIWLFGLSVAAAQTPQAERRVALVIGNSAYNGVAALKNAASDGQLIADGLRRTGFEVSIAIDANRTSMLEAIYRFNASAQNADVAMIYYAGHGLEADGKNWIIPTDATLANVMDLPFQAIDLDTPLTSVSRARKLRLLVVDAARNNPFERLLRGATRAVGRGLGTITEIPREDMLVVFSASPGTVAMDGAGRYSPFAEAFHRRMLEPGIELNMMLRRLRADVSAATAARQEIAIAGAQSPFEFYFAGRPAAAPPAPVLAFTDQPRIALVIGQSDYNRDNDTNDDARSTAVRQEGFAPDLPNPVNDARDIKAALERIRFNVDLVENADYQTLLTALFEFEKKVMEAGPDALVIIHYSGHAIQVGGANFMIPVGAKLPAQDPRDILPEQAELLLSQYALPLQTSLMGRLRPRSAQGLNLVILDACRENPWEARAGRAVTGRSVGRGLADIKTGLTRTVISYATKEGDIAEDGEGRNSPYTSALLSLIERPGLTVRDLLDEVSVQVQTASAASGGRQTPYYYGPGIGTTCLGACATPR